ncbi:berberine and berberine like-domain-containing protein [Lineolata rhizophorae]|uniref:Berberine and berberine like-domain-containing protein n=1 Tax=Lineolata rhizophorae TaxID=578093 RepID=A0A6A6NXB6_9PEZI|nr:berberine and berberine like-domain-containing protein [Lineolata rhizophorae]
MRFLIAGGFFALSGVYYGPAEDLAEYRGMLARLGNATEVTVEEVGWMESLEANANGQPLEMSGEYPYHDTFFAKSLMSPALSADAIAAFVDYWFDQAADLPFTRNWYVIVDLYGGPTSAIGAVGRDATAYAHRAATLLKMQFYDRVFFGAYPDDGFGFLDGWVAAVVRAMPAARFGMYINYADTSLSRREAHEMYWGENYERLARVKAVWDPEEVFTFPQAVTPA